MAELTETLTHGLKLTDKDGRETWHKEAVLKEPLAGDLLDATAEAERVVATPDGYQLLASPTAVSVGVLRRQVVRIGEIQGPLSLVELRRLHPDDLRQLQSAADRLEIAGLKEIADRGRASGTPG